MKCPALFDILCKSSAICLQKKKKEKIYIYIINLSSAAVVTGSLMAK